MSRGQIGAIVIVAWVAAAILIFRVVIPALINTHNDGLLIAGGVIGFFTIVAPVSIYNEFFKEQGNEG